MASFIANHRSLYFQSMKTTPIIDNPKKQIGIIEVIIENTLRILVHIFDTLILLKKIIKMQNTKKGIEDRKIMA